MDHAPAASNWITGKPSRVPSARRVGELLRASDSTDLVDAHVALLVPSQGTILTSDDADMPALLRARGVKARVVHV